MLESTRSRTSTAESSGGRPVSGSQGEQGLRVNLHWNSPSSAKLKPVEVTVRRNISLNKFKRVCAKELKVKAKKIYQTTGEEVQFMDEVRQGATLFVSQGEPFFKNKDAKAGDEVVNLRFAVVGKGGVGKSAITLRYVRNFFVNFWSHTVEDAYQKTVDYNRQLYKLSILDTAGQDNFESLRAQWMSDKDGYLFVYDKTDKSSLAELKEYYRMYSKLNPQSEAKGPIPIILCANKKDLVTEDPSKEQVSKQEGQTYATNWGAHYIETSAKTGENIAEVFETLLKINSKKSTPEKIEAGLSKCSIL